MSELVERAVTLAMSWHPSENGPFYTETKAEVMRLLAEDVARLEAEVETLRDELAALNQRLGTVADPDRTLDT
jgi:hypothetical protein